MKNLTFKTFLPIFPGFYNTIFEPCEDSLIEDDKTYDDYKFNYDKYRNDVAIETTKAIQNKLNEILNTTEKNFNIIFETIVSPKFYNYSNDSINVTINTNKKTINNILNYLKNNQKEFEIYIKDNFTSYDGFISFYSNNSKDWIETLKNNTLKEENLSHYLDFILLNEDYKADTLFFEISENCFLETI